MEKLKNFFLGVLLTLTLSLLSPFTYGQPVTYSDVTITSGFIHDYGYTLIGGTINMGAGVSFCDFDGDGFDDLTLTSEVGQPVYLFQNTGTGTFSDVTPPALLLDTNESKVALWADYDNDGDKDLFVGSYQSPSHLYRNDGAGAFVDVTATAGITTSAMNTMVASWGDYNNDSYLDLYIGNYEFSPTGFNYLYKNNGDGTFSDVTMAAAVQDSAGPALASLFFDYDNDMDQDLFIGNDRDLRRNTLFQNNGDETFTDVTVASATDEFMWSMGVAVGDYDNNGYLDIYVTNGNAGNRFHHNNGDGTFSEISTPLGVTVNKICWGTTFFDYDNDGDLDLYSAASQDTTTNDQARNSFFGNNGDATFTSLFGIGLEDSSNSLGTAVGDYNNDGFYDLAVVNGNGDLSRIYENDGGAGNWLKLELVGTSSNRDGVGSMIYVTSDTMTYLRSTHCGVSFGSQDSYSNIFGVGADTLIELIIVNWPSGISDTLKNVPVNQKIMLEEGSTLISASVTTNNTSCAEATDGSIEISASGGTGASYTYSWSPAPPDGDSTGNVAGLSGGTWNVTITSGFGCRELSILVDEPLPVPTPTISLAGDSLMSSPATTYQWIMDGAVIPGATDQYHYPLSSGDYQVIVWDSMSCPSDTSLPQTVTITGISSRVTSGKLEVWPNPGTGTFFLMTDYPAEFNLEVFDLRGTSIFSAKLTSQGGNRINEMDLSGYPSGIYLVKVSGTNLHQTSRIILR